MILLIFYQPASKDLGLGPHLLSAFLNYFLYYSVMHFKNILFYFCKKTFIRCHNNFFVYKVKLSKVQTFKHAPLEEGFNVMRIVFDLQAWYFKTTLRL